MCGGRKGSAHVSHRLETTTDSDLEAPLTSVGLREKDRLNPIFGSFLERDGHAVLVSTELAPLLCFRVSRLT